MEKLDKKSVFSAHCGDGTTAYYDSAFCMWPYYWVWSVYFHNIVKINTFYVAFSLYGLAEVFCWLGFWSFKRLCIICVIFYLHNMVKNMGFLSNFLLADSMLGVFYWLFLWNFKKSGINHFLWYTFQKIKYQGCVTENDRCFISLCSKEISNKMS